MEMGICRVAVADCREPERILSQVLGVLPANHLSRVWTACMRNTDVMPVTNLEEKKRPRPSGSSAQHFVKGHEIAHTCQSNTDQLLLSGIE
jgi:hypothetical protein